MNKVSACSAGNKMFYFILKYTILNLFKSYINSLNSSKCNLSI